MQRLVALGAWSVLLLACVLAYLPGLSGPFMLDDYGVLTFLGERGGVTDWETFRTFVFGGSSGPTGRPLSLVTFLIDANNWPAEPFPFKRTNLVIHIVNGVLLGIIIGQVLNLMQFDRQAVRWITLVAVGCWLLHPFLVSTTLYVVQRMAQLSTLFCFAGIAVYLKGRTRLPDNKIQGYLLMSLAVAVFTFLAMIAKENGVLLPMLIGVLEITVIASQSHRLPRLNTHWAIVFLALPSCVIGLYLGSQFFKDGFFEMVVPRDYSLYERLLTEPRILVEYLQHWFVPKLYTTGVYQDHFIKSTGFFSPVTTALSTLLHLTLIAAAIAKRRAWPLFGLAVLFYYASHLIESTVINLELYFEHRNYLGACFLFLPFIAVLYEKARTRTFVAAAIVIGLILGGFTHYSATVWQSLPGMAAASARKAPTSARAQAQYATQLFNAGRTDEALEVLDRAIEIIPSDNPHLLVNRLIILCVQDQLDLEEFQRVAALLSNLRFDGRLIKTYGTFASKVVDQNCPAVSAADLRSMFSDMLNVPANQNRALLEYSHINYLLGLAEAYSGNAPQAVAAFEASLESRPGASHAMIMAAHLANAGLLGEALHLSDIALTQQHVVRLPGIDGPRVSESDIRAFQDVVRADMEAVQSNGTSRPEQ